MGGGVKDNRTKGNRTTEDGQEVVEKKELGDEKGVNGVRSSRCRRGRK